MPLPAPVFAAEALLAGLFHEPLPAVADALAGLAQLPPSAPAFAAGPLAGLHQLQHRDPSLPDDVEILLKPNQRFVKDQHAIQTATLAWCEGDQTYRGRLTLPAATIARLHANPAAANENGNHQATKPGAHFATVLKDE